MIGFVTSCSRHSRRQGGRESLVLLCIAVAMGSSCCPIKAEPGAANATVVKVVDGDTVDVRSDDRGRLRIRVVGIDTPEVKRPNYTVGCGGVEASQYAEELLAGQRVAIVADPSQDVRDRYGRTLAEIFLSDGRNYAVEAARTGHAHSYVYAHRPSQWATQIADAERQAQESKIGIWGPPCLGHTESVPTH
jgi:micrococcal nuclease